MKWKNKTVLMSLLVQFILTVIRSVISRMGAFLWCIHTVGDYSGWLTVMKIRIKNIGKTSHIRRHYGAKHCKGQQHWPSFIDGKITRSKLNQLIIKDLNRCWSRINVIISSLSNSFLFLSIFSLSFSFLFFVFHSLFNWI